MFKEFRTSISIGPRRPYDPPGNLQDDYLPGIRSLDKWQGSKLDRAEFPSVCRQDRGNAIVTMTDLSQYYWTSFGSAPMDQVEADVRQGGIKDERIIEAALQVRPGDFRPWEILPRPAVVAGIAEALQPTSDSKVLDVGTGTGYLAAVLAVLLHRVITLEVSETFAAFAGRNLDDLPCGHNVIVINGDGGAGYPEEAPYDCISVHGCLREVPPELREQLVDGGSFSVLARKTSMNCN